MDAVPILFWLYLAACLALVVGTIGALFLIVAIEDRRFKREVDDLLNGR